MELLGRGAEAEIYLAEFSEVFGDYFTGKVIVKRRVPKRYRVREIDLKLRRERTVMEARIMHRAKLAGVRCPHVYEVNLRDMEIVMEFIEGERLKELLESLPMKDRLTLCREIGKQVGKLHAAGIIHGDLTTSNMIYRNGRIYFIDFGLAEFDSKVEGQGVDLHLLKRAMESTHYLWFEEGFREVIRGYSSVRGEEAAPVVSKISEIEKRGRYRERG